VALSPRFLALRLEATLDRLHPLPPVRTVDLRDVLGQEAVPFLAGNELAAIERTVREAGREGPGPAAVHDADLALARACYALCRALRPETVVETGVANGVTSAFLLQALELNGTGALHSIDLPARGAEPGLVGRLVPEELRSRWTLHRGPSRRLLPSLVGGVAPVGIFVHDSRHTYRNVCFELATVTPFLGRPAAVLVDDAERHSAFPDWAARQSPRRSGLVRASAKASLFGVAVL
jgi:Methyltransferase domain